VVERCNQYAESGADAILVDGPVSKEEMHRFGTEIRSRYHVVNMGGSAKRRTTPKLPFTELESMGYELVIFGLQMVRIASVAMYDFARTLKVDGIAADLDVLEKVKGTPFEDWYSFTGFDRIRQQEERYLPAQELSKYETGPESYYQPGSVK
jgi:2-methylisocitrate lyase-like PEP mutase family enzyme